MGFNSVSIIVFAVSLAFLPHLNLRAQVPDPEEYRKAERAKMLVILEGGFPDSELVIAKMAEASAAQQAMANYYLKEIRPIERQMHELVFKSSWHSIALDRALYNDESEKKSWEAVKQESADALDAIGNSDSFKAKVKEWARLSEGLTGFLADEARRSWKNIEIASFSENQLPLLREKNELGIKVDAAANESPFGSNMGDVAEQISKIRADYLAHKISIQRAGELVEAQRARGQAGLSRDIAQKVGPEMNRAAVINSILAKSKGYKSWAEYQVAVQAEPYEARFNTVAGRVKFLEEALQSTDALLEELLANLADSDGTMKRGDLRESHVELLSPDADGFGVYYPVEKIDELWTKTVLGEGFKQGDADHIYRDNFPRPNKYTHGYMNGVNGRTPKAVGLDVSTLNMQLPDSSASEMWTPANIFIVQNFFSDAMDSVRVAFHEGGHALHFTYEENPFGFPHAYGYVEIHSILQEHFFLDRDFVLATAQTREGKRPTEKEVDDYMRNVKIQEFLTFRIILARALFELKLWDFDYENSAQTWTDRAIQLWGEVIARGTGVKGTEGHGVDSTGRGPLNGPHFRAGDIRYIGYSQASIAAYISVEEMRERLLKETGRATFLGQPSMAKNLIEGYYRKGFEHRFPLSVEAFTGKPYSVDDYVQFLASAIHAMRPVDPSATKACEKLLPKAAEIQPPSP
jgi:hypothetical protein